MVPIDERAGIAPSRIVLAIEEYGPVFRKPTRLPVEIVVEIVFVIVALDDGIVNRRMRNVEPRHDIGIRTTQGVPIDRELADVACDIARIETGRLRDCLVFLLTLQIAVCDGAKRRDAGREDDERDDEDGLPQPSLAAGCRRPDVLRLGALCRARRPRPALAHLWSRSSNASLMALSAWMRAYFLSSLSSTIQGANVVDVRRNMSLIACLYCG